MTLDDILRLSRRHIITLVLSTLLGVALAAGLHASRLDGSALRYNNADTYIPDIVICRPELADDILEAAARYRDEHGTFEGVAK